MNAYKRLTLEVKGICGIIDDYTSSADIQNYMNQLQKGIADRDYEVITYSLNNIIEWYSQNWEAMENNEFLYNLPAHYRNCELLEEIRNDITEADCKDYTSTSSDVSSANTNDPIIFISHRSSDRKYGDALRNFIVGLGVKDDQLIYTSHPLHKIPLDQNIYDYLRNNIHRNVFMIILWSDEYLESPACLNEMGAAWVAQTDYTNIYTPDFSFNNPKYHQCAVDTKKMGAVLNGDRYCRPSMIELKNKIISMFDLQVDEKKMNFLLDQFMEAISSKE